MDHLPECIYEPEHFDTEQNIVWGWKPCICDALRACEQRLLDAAREAISGLRTYGDHGEVIPPDEEAAVIYVTEALAAIDALRKKP